MKDETFENGKGCFVDGSSEDDDEKGGNGDDEDGDKVE